MNFRILYQDQYLVVIDKPAGFHVHPPEDNRHRISRQSNCLALLKEQLGLWLYPVHRLDRSTSGVLVFALSSQVARDLQLQFQRQTVDKRYLALCRGVFSSVYRPETESTKIIWNMPLISPEGVEQEAETWVYPLAHLEWPFAVGKYAQAKYTLLEVAPRTGRMHQIRRHAQKASHPLVGDTVYGDGPHNRLFRETIKIEGLFLKAWILSFSHPVTGLQLTFRSRFQNKWHQIFDKAGLCPYRASTLATGVVASLTQI